MGPALPVEPAPRSRARKTLARQRQILDAVVAEGSCTAQELAQAFGVSIMTVHRDLDELERRGVVRKFHGGVTALPSAVFEAQMKYRMAANRGAKEQIGRAALAHVESGSSLILDDSSTVLHMVHGLPDLSPLHIATTCMTALRQLSEVADEGLRIIGLGGDYDPMHDSFVGMNCVEQIEGIRADALFMSTSAVSGSNAFHQEERIVSVKRAMMKVATRSYLLIDGSKFGKVGLHKLCPLKAFDLVICDPSVPRSALLELEHEGVAYEVAPE